MTVPENLALETALAQYAYFMQDMFWQKDTARQFHLIVYTMFCLSRNLWTFLWWCDVVFQTYIKIICLPKKYYPRSIANISLNPI